MFRSEITWMPICRCEDGISRVLFATNLDKLNDEIDRELMENNIPTQQIVTVKIFKGEMLLSEKQL